MEAVSSAVTLYIRPPAFLDDPALVAVLAALPDARIVGGAVRDALAERPVADVDLATPDTPETTIHRLDAAGLRHAPTGLQHGTVTAISGSRGFEVTTLRTDERTDGRHAEVAWTTDWQQDAARRDFTINAMSMERDGAIHDYFGGIEDLHAGRVRFVGDAATRIAEDYLRVLRFFRFQARYGDTPPDAATEHAIRSGIPGLSRLSAERVWSELKRILAIPDPRAALRLMSDWGVLDAVLHHPTTLARLDLLVAAGAPADALLRLAALDPAADCLAAPLKLSKQEAATLSQLAGPPPDPAWSDDALRRAMADTPAAVLIGRSWLVGFDAPAWAALRTRLDTTARPVFALSGRDAVHLGILPGPQVGALLDAVRSWWLAQGCVPDAAACRAELARRV